MSNFCTLVSSPFLDTDDRYIFSYVSEIPCYPSLFPYQISSAATTDNHQTPTRHRHKIQNEECASSLPLQRSLYIPPDSYLRKILLSRFNLVEIPKDISHHDIEPHSFHHLQTVAPILVSNMGVMTHVISTDQL